MNRDNRPFNAPNVVQLHPTPKEGDLTFFVCGCDPKAPHPFVAIVQVAARPWVRGFQCPACEQWLEVVEGFVQSPNGVTRTPTRQETIAKAEEKLGNADLDDGR